MAPRSCAHRSPCVNLPPDLAGEQDKLADIEDPVRGSNVGSDEAPTKASTPLEAPIPPLVPLPTEDLFTKLMKLFIETTQAQARAEP